ILACEARGNGHFRLCPNKQTTRSAYTSQRLHQRGKLPYHDITRQKAQVDQIKPCRGKNLVIKRVYIISKNAHIVQPSYQDFTLLKNRCIRFYSGNMQRWVSPCHFIYQPSDAPTHIQHAIAPRLFERGTHDTTHQCAQLLVLRPQQLSHFIKTSLWRPACVHAAGGNKGTARGDIRPLREAVLKRTAKLWRISAHRVEARVKFLFAIAVQA